MVPWLLSTLALIVSTWSAAVADEKVGILPGAVDEKRVYTTVNSGITWRATTISVGCRAVCSFGSSLFVLGFDTKAFKPRAVVSHDSGATWSDPIKLPSLMSSCVAITTSQIFAAGENGQVAGSTDGGATWTTLYETFHNSENFHAILATGTPGRLLAFGNRYDNVGQFVPEVIVSEDGGSSWTNFTWTFNNEGFQMSAAARCPGPTYIAADGDGNAYVSRDRDATKWSQQRLGFTEDIQAAACIGDSEVWLSEYALGSGVVAIQVSSDSGRTFTRTDLTNTNVVPMSFISFSANGSAVWAPSTTNHGDGDRSRLLVTFNGGSKWHPVNLDRCPLCDSS